MGAELSPGGAAPFPFGLDAAALGGAHVSLDALWGREAALVRERVLGAKKTPEERLPALESRPLAVAPPPPARTPIEAARIPRSTSRSPPRFRRTRPARTRGLRRPT